MDKTAMLSLKRTITSLVLASVLIGGAWFLSKNNDSSGAVAGVDNIDYSASEIDTDGDGLKDWEERLWKTSSDSKDTDGDGTSDGEEVRLKRDPSVKGPNDAIDDVLLSRNEAVKGFIEDEDLNLSSSFGRSILSTYLQNQADGNSAGQVEAIELLLAEKLPIARTFILSDLTVSPNKTVDAFKVYGNSLATALLKGATESESELTIFARALDKKDESELKKLDPIISALEAKIEACKDITIPFTAAEAHLSLLNSLESAKYDISGMKVVFNDPVLAFLALNSYKKSSDKVLTDISALKTLVKNSGAVFIEGEAGAKFFGK
jgi:hypothetical protein